MKNALSKLIDRYTHEDDVKVASYMVKYYVGIEIECFGHCSASDLYAEFLERDLESFVNVTDDGSIDADDGEETFELRLLIPQDRLDELMTEFGKVFKKLKLKVNDTCGLHVHLDCRNREPAKVLQRLERAQDVLFAMVKRERWNNQYCQFRTGYNAGNKYTAINTRPLMNYRTIEVRVHHGTVNAKEITLWVKLLINIISGRPMKKVKAKKDFLSWAGLSKDAELKSYVAAKFKDTWFDARVAALRRQEDANEGNDWQAA